MKRHGLSKNVIMLGHREDIPQILSSIDLFVLPTLQEALGTSFIEAMAMGKPVIGSNIDGVREVIDNGLNGYLVPPEAPVVLAEKIIDLLSNRGKAKEFGVHGREKVENKYTIEKMCNGMLEVYLKHLKKL
ncbi:glycosyltransferase family 4 protein [Thermodesulfovibrio sp. 3462-1]|uniref:Glycosyltransferase family 4 protein n=1 Tax=Thermodesulfovibrio obliviosus TaxID=3118332 RepID=A0AAU8H6S8_9BACT